MAKNFLEENRLESRSSLYAYWFSICMCHLYLALGLLSKCMWGSSIHAHYFVLDVRIKGIASGELQGLKWKDWLCLLRKNHHCYMVLTEYLESNPAPLPIYSRHLNFFPTLTLSLFYPTRPRPLISFLSSLSPVGTWFHCSRPWSPSFFSVSCWQLIPLL